MTPGGRPTDLVGAAAAAVAEATGGLAPQIGVVLGSGLGAVAETVAAPVALPYADLPGFPAPTVDGHAGRLLLGRLGGRPVAVLQGRAHGYEGDPAAMAVPIRTLRRLGCRVLVLTAAVGALDAALAPGRLVLVTDHLALGALSPLTGPNDPAIGPRFVAMDAAYDPKLTDRIAAAASALDLPLAGAVLAHMPGPQFETAAETRALRALGADIVGMSLANECILARHCGLAVAALAVVVNGPPAGPEASAAPPEEPHATTLTVAARAAPALARLLDRAVPALTDGGPP